MDGSQVKARVYKMTPFLYPNYEKENLILRFSVSIYILEIQRKMNKHDSVIIQHYCFCVCVGHRHSVS
jgi:hypothetical protein